MSGREIVKEVLERTLTLEFAKGRSRQNPETDQDTVVSMLIHDIFGGEILKTREKKGWHFYNRINGERIDFTGADTYQSCTGKEFEDIPATFDETCSYIDVTDYSTFFMRFVRAFEEAVGLGGPGSRLAGNRI